LIFLRLGVRMRRVVWIAVLIFLIVFSASMMVAAQESTPEPTPLPPDPMENAIARAERAADEAARYAAETGSLLGIFEVAGAVIGVVTGLLPILAIVAGFIGLNRLNSAQNELEEARERLEKEISARQAELVTLRDQLEENAERLREEGRTTREQLREELRSTGAQQRDESAKATLALALLPLGERQYRAQDYKGALDTYQRALELDNDNPVTHYRMGYVYTQSGQLEDAVDHLTRSLEIAPDFAPALAALGYVYRRIGEKMPKSIDRDTRLNLAEQKLLQALKISPKLIDDDGESWWGSLGGLYRRRGQTDEAIKAYTEASEVTPHSSYPFSNLALLYIEKNDREKMVRTYKRVERLAGGEVQAEVDNYWAYADLIVARLALGKPIDDIFETAIGTAPVDSPYTLDSLVDTLERLSAVLTPEEQVPVKAVITQIREIVAVRKSQLAAQQS
jgi:tetratricopeptide (TPR) repeat protein